MSRLFSQRRCSGRDGWQVAPSPHRRHACTPVPVSDAARSSRGTGRPHSPAAWGRSSLESGNGRLGKRRKSSPAKLPAVRYNRHNRNHPARFELVGVGKLSRKTKLRCLRKFFKLSFCGSRLVSSAASAGTVVESSHSLVPPVLLPTPKVRLSWPVRSMCVSVARGAQPHSATAHSVLPEHPASYKVALS